jgi:hypothetical protein
MLKQTLIDIGQDYMQFIYDHLKMDAKNDLNSLIDTLRTTVHDLKQPTPKLEQLKINQDKFS